MYKFGIFKQYFKYSNPIKYISYGYILECLKKDKNNFDENSSTYGWYCWNIRFKNKKKQTYEKGAVLFTFWISLKTTAGDTRGTIVIFTLFTCMSSLRVHIKSTGIYLQIIWSTIDNNKCNNNKIQQIQFDVL